MCAQLLEKRKKSGYSRAGRVFPVTAKTPDDGAGLTNSNIRLMGIIRRIRTHCYSVDYFYSYLTYTYFFSRQKIPQFRKNITVFIFFLSRTNISCYSNRRKNILRNFHFNIANLFRRISN